MVLIGALLVGDLLIGALIGALDGALLIGDLLIGALIGALLVGALLVGALIGTLLVGDLLVGALAGALIDALIGALIGALLVRALIGALLIGALIGLISCYHRYKNKKAGDIAAKKARRKEQNAYASARDTAQYGSKSCQSCSQFISSNATSCKHCGCFATKDAMVAEQGKPTQKHHTSLSQLSNRKTAEALEEALYKSDGRQDFAIEAIKGERTDGQGVVCVVALTTCC